MTPRSDVGEGDPLDSSSSRGQTPAPGDSSFDHSGPTTPSADIFFGSDPQQKGGKRKPATQPKRRLSAGNVFFKLKRHQKDKSAIFSYISNFCSFFSGKEQLNSGTGSGKKRARKGSKVEGESDYDTVIDTIMTNLKTMPPINTLEPKFPKAVYPCPIYGSGEMPKYYEPMPDFRTGTLQGSFGKAFIPNHGDYYSVMPFGPDPPVPDLKYLTNNHKGFYSQEFAPKEMKKVDRALELLASVEFANRSKSESNLSDKLESQDDYKPTIQAEGLSHSSIQEITKAKLKSGNLFQSPRSQARLSSLSEDQSNSESAKERGQGAQGDSDDIPMVSDDEDMLNIEPEDMIVDLPDQPHSPGIFLSFNLVKGCERILGAHEAFEDWHQLKYNSSDTSS